jgi:hypothetical protein
MLSVEVKINGSIISLMNVVNVRGDSEVCEYEYQMVRFPASGRGEPSIRTGKVFHKRSDGAEALVGNILETLSSHD